MEKLYQDVWSHVFASTWVAYEGILNNEDRRKTAKMEADTAAVAALSGWDPMKAHTAVAAKGQE